MMSITAFPGFERQWGSLGEALADRTLVEFDSNQLCRLAVITASELLDYAQRYVPKQIFELRPHEVPVLEVAGDRLIRRRPELIGLLLLKAELLYGIVLADVNCGGRLLHAMDDSVLAERSCVAEALEAFQTIKTVRFDEVRSREGDDFGSDLEFFKEDFTDHNDRFLALGQKEAGAEEAVVA